MDTDRDDAPSVRSLPVLVVDDDREILETLNRLLLKFGFTDVHCFSSPTEALAAAESVRFGAALLDYRMPDLDGRSLYEGLAERSPDTIAILMTAHGETALVDRAMAAGFHGYLEKPFPHRLLTSQLLGALYRHTARVNRRLVQYAKDEWLETMDALPHLVFRAGVDDQLLRLNRQALAFLGDASFDQVLGRPLPDLVPAATGLIGAVHAVPEVMSEERRIDGRWWTVTVAPLTQEGAFVGYNLTLTDIGVLVHAREKVARADRIYGLGLTRAGLANDLRLLARELRQGIEALSAAGARLRDGAAADRADAFAAFDRLLASVADADGRLEEFAQAEMRRAADAHDPAPHPMPVPLGRFLTTFAAELRAEVPSLDVRLPKGAAEALPTVRADRVALHLALAHLCRNAAEARADATVRLAVEPAEDAGLVRLVVEDEAGGMSEDEERRAFEPFFSTKEEHLGFGLNSVERIAADHGGSVTLANRPARGVRVTLTLPRAD
ncbi:MAG: response regulator [Planctomycetota bacterium]